MNPQQAKELLESPIFKAFAEGKTIQVEYSQGWTDIKYFSAHPVAIVTEPTRYRIKPEPRVYWAIVNKMSGQNVATFFKESIAYSCLENSFADGYEVIQLIEVI
jgi:hypothetical protein